VTVSLATFWPHLAAREEVEAVGPGVRLVGVEVAVEVQRDRDGGVSEDALNDLRWGSSDDLERGGGVPQAVRSELSKPGGGDGRGPDMPAEVRHAQRAARGSGEDQ